MDCIALGCKDDETVTIQLIIITDGLIFLFLSLIVYLSSVHLLISTLSFTLSLTLLPFLFLLLSHIHKHTHSYMIGEVLGKGAFSTVRLAVSKTTNKKWAGDNIIDVHVHVHVHMRVTIYVDDGEDEGYGKREEEGEDCIRN